MINRERAVARGRRNKAVGSMFESWVDEQHVRAGQLGILAHVVHNEGQSRVVGGRLIFTAPGVADFSGVLASGGVTLAAEAKSTSCAYLPKSEVSLEQQRHLSAVADAGGLALLLVEFRAVVPPLYRRFVMKWWSVPWRVLRTAESVSAADITESCLIAPDECYLSKFHPGSDNRYVVGEAQRRRHVHPRE